MRWGALALAFCIMVGGVLIITDEGIELLVTNPPVRFSTGSVLIISAIIGSAISIRGKLTQ